MRFKEGLGIVRKGGREYSYREKGINMGWFKKHTDTVVVLSGILGSFIWMVAQLNAMNKDLGAIKTDMAVVKAVLIMKNIMPPDLAVKSND